MARRTKFENISVIPSSVRYTLLPSGKQLLHRTLGSVLNFKPEVTQEEKWRGISAGTKAITNPRGK